MDRFVGEFEHTLDPKGRVILPTRFRPAFAGGGYLVRGDEGCITLMTAARYDARLDQIDARLDEEDSEENREELRRFTSAEPVTPDAQGRIPISGKLQRFAGLRKTGVVILGASRTVEIWDPVAYAEMIDRPIDARLKRRRTDSTTESRTDSTTDSSTTDSSTTDSSTADRPAPGPEAS